MTVLSELYASGGTDVILHTIELFSGTWGEPIVLVQDYADHTITTEDARELVAQACGMDVALPKRDASGAQSLTFALDGVRSEATRLLRSAESAQEQVRLTYRCYLASDLSAPAEQPYYFIVRSFTAEASKIQVTAGLFDLIDLKWPREVYNSTNAPGLKYLQ